MILLFVDLIGFSWHLFVLQARLFGDWLHAKYHLHWCRGWFCWSHGSDIVIC